MEGEPARLGLEKLLINAGVSAVFSGHVHAYERSFPVNNNAVVPAGPGGMTHLNIGDAGAGLYVRGRTGGDGVAVRRADRPPARTHTPPMHTPTPRQEAHQVPTTPSQR